MGGKTTSLGDHDLEDDAARTFDIATINRLGLSGKLNFPAVDYAPFLGIIASCTWHESVTMLRRVRVAWQSRIPPGFDQALGPGRYRDAAVLLLQLRRCCRGRSGWAAGRAIGRAVGLIATLLAFAGIAPSE